MNVEVAAESRCGLITRALARAQGMSESAIDRRIASGRWVPVLPGVYRVRGAPVTARQRALTASLWGGDDALVSHLVAGRLLRLDGVPRPTRMEISVPRSTSLGAADVVVHRTSLGPLDRVVVDDIPLHVGDADDRRPGGPARITLALEDRAA